jgi:hypothetical protein
MTVLAGLAGSEAGSPSRFASAPFKGLLRRARDAMRATLDVGDAAMHRAFKPTEHDLKIVLDVVEGILSPIFGHKDAAEKLADRVPPRASKPSKPIAFYDAFHRFMVRGCGMARPPYFSSI